MAYTTIDKPSDYFDTKLHTGTGGSKTLAYDFEVDFYWTKMRNDVYPHNLFDSSRGNNALLRANQTNSEVSAANTVSFGNASGVTLGSDGSSYGVNQANNDSGSSATFVGFAWKANGGTTSSNSDGDITSTVQANTTAGFSIITYTGNGTSGGQTVGHGLGVAPSWIIVKERGNTRDWNVFHHKNTSAPATDFLVLNNTDATADAANRWNDTMPSSSVITIGDTARVNDPSGLYVMYAWTEIQGYSKFGSYTGNASEDGPFIYTGFKPQWLMIRNTKDGEGWMLHDATVDEEGGNGTSGNPRERRFQVNETQAEVGTTTAFDFLSNGFKLRTDTGSHNGSGDSFIYMAFAEHPFVSSKGVPVTAG